MEIQLDLVNYKRVRNNLIFTNTLHRTKEQKVLAAVFYTRNATKMGLVVVELAFTAYFHNKILLTDSGNSY